MKVLFYLLGVIALVLLANRLLAGHSAEPMQASSNFRYLGPGRCQGPTEDQTLSMTLSMPFDLTVEMSPEERFQKVIEKCSKRAQDYQTMGKNCTGFSVTPDRHCILTLEGAEITGSQVFDPRAPPGQTPSEDEQARVCYVRK